MTKTQVNVLPILSLFLLISQVAQAASDQDLVDQFYPSRLAAREATFKSRKLPRQSAFVLADLDIVGTPNYIVVAYSNSIDGDVRVLRKIGETASLISDSNLPAMNGSRPQISLVDVDGDKKPEIEVSFTSGRGVAMNWYFNWHNYQLQVIGPTLKDRYGRVLTDISNGSLMDLDGDGILEIVDGPSSPRPSPGEDMSKPVPLKIYRLVNGKYIEGSTLLFADTFTRKAGAPVSKNASFSIDRTDKPYLLRVVNGKRDGTDRVSSAEIFLNGKLVAGPDKFNQKVAVLTIPITPAVENQLSVTLRSTPGSQLLITVESKR